MPERHRGVDCEMMTLLLLIVIALMAMAIMMMTMTMTMTMMGGEGGCSDGRVTVVTARNADAGYDVVGRLWALERCIGGSDSCLKRKVCTKRVMCVLLCRWPAFRSSIGVLSM